MVAENGAKPRRVLVLRWGFLYLTETKLEEHRQVCDSPLGFERRCRVILNRTQDYPA